MKKRFLALALGTLAFGVTLGGVKMGLGHQDALMVKAAEDQPAETVCQTLTFPDENQKNNAVTTYKNEWKAKIGDNSYTIKNFNNNGWKSNWKYIKCGYKNEALVASISTDNPIPQAISKVVVTFDAITAASVNSISLVALDGEKAYETIPYADKKAGKPEFALTTPKANLTYRLEISCEAVKAVATVSKLEFFTKNDAPTEPASPIKSISATRKNPDAVFYAGDKVTLDDFVITATHENDTSSVLKTGVTIENPDLVEGANVLNFVYGSGETERRCQFIVNAVKANFYSKSTNIADIVVGKKIYIADPDGTAIIGAQNDNNRASTSVVAREGKIVAQDSYCSFLVLPAKNGTFALYDEINKGVLYAAGTGQGKNYLRTQKVFDNIDANSFANITYSKTWSIQFTGSNTNKNLRYNSQYDIFSCYSSGQAAPSIYVSPDAPASFKADAWADSFIANVSSKCDATGETATWTADWDKAKAVFDGFGIPDKMAVLYGTGSEKVNQAIATYKFIVDKYNIDDYLGLGTGKTNKANALMLPGATDSTTWTLVGIGAVTIAASASLLFFRRKKSN